jgi:hypothetical protein
LWVAVRIRCRAIQVERQARRAAAQFAYLVAGELHDRAMLVGTTPPRKHVIACARDGVETFLARYEALRGGRGRTR